MTEPIQEAGAEQVLWVTTAGDRHPKCTARSVCAEISVQSGTTGYDNVREKVAQEYKNVRKDQQIISECTPLTVFTKLLQISSSLEG